MPASSSSLPSDGFGRRQPRPSSDHKWSGSVSSCVSALFAPQTWLTTLHLALCLPMGIGFFTVMVVGLALVAGLAITFPLAVPVLWATLAASRGFGRVERSRARALLGIQIEEPHRLLPDSVPWWRRLRHAATERSTWREVSYHLLLLPVGAVLFTGAVIVWTLPVLLMSLPLLTRVLPGGRAMLFGYRLPVYPLAAIGVIVLLSAPLVIRWLGKVDAFMVGRLLHTPKEDALTERVQVLETSRSALVGAVDAERRRIERDLHDGAQQRLVTLAMDLGRLREKLSDDGEVTPDAQELLLSAHTDAKLAISELREVARGVHPAILEDRGLDAALSSLAARCPVPVDITVDLIERPPRPIETVAYYLVAEALTNVAKHGRATRVTVRLAQSDSRLVVEVTDDGQGGAIVGEGGGLGGGLAGLRDRVAAVDGWLQVLSPVGGPTTVLAELPCE